MTAIVPTGQMVLSNGGNVMGGVEVGVYFPFHCVPLSKMKVFSTAVFLAQLCSVFSF